MNLKSLVSWVIAAAIVFGLGWWIAGPRLKKNAPPPPVESAGCGSDGCGTDVTYEELAICVDESLGSMIRGDKETQKAIETREINISDLIPALREQCEAKISAVAPVVKPVVSFTMRSWYELAAYSMLVVGGVILLVSLFVRSLRKKNREIEMLTTAEERWHDRARDFNVHATQVNNMNVVHFRWEGGPRPVSVKEYHVQTMMIGLGCEWRTVKVFDSAEAVSSYKDEAVYGRSTFAYRVTARLIDGAWVSSEAAFVTMKEEPSWEPPLRQTELRQRPVVRHEEPKKLEPPAPVVAPAPSSSKEAKSEDLSGRTLAGFPELVVPPPPKPVVAPVSPPSVVGAEELKFDAATVEDSAPGFGEFILQLTPDPSRRTPSSPFRIELTPAPAPAENKKDDVLPPPPKPRTEPTIL